MIKIHDYCRFFFQIDHESDKDIIFFPSSRHSTVNDEADVSSVLTTCIFARHRLGYVGKEKAKENSARFFFRFFSPLKSMGRER